MSCPYCAKPSAASIAQATARARARERWWLRRHAAVVKEVAAMPARCWMQHRHCLNCDILRAKAKQGSAS